MQHAAVDRPPLPVRTSELMADVRVADHDELAAPTLAGGRAAGEVEEREHGVVVDRIGAQATHRRLRVHHVGE